MYSLYKGGPGVLPRKTLENLECRKSPDNVDTFQAWLNRYLSHDNDLKKVFFPTSNLATAPVGQMSTIAIFA